MSSQNFESLEIVEAKGATIKDRKGDVYIDFFSGNSVLLTGYQHPKIVEALKKQAETLIWHGQGYYHHLHEELVVKLDEITPGNFPKTVILGCGGSISNDCALTMALLSTGRTRIASYTGTNCGSGTYMVKNISSMSPKWGYPVLPGVVHFPYPYCYRCPFKLNYPKCNLYCIDFIEDTVFKSYCAPEDVACLITEVILGDGGWIVPPKYYWTRIKKMCEKHEILFIAEEVQSGMGRAGKISACEYWGIEPDIITLGKGLGGGMPVSACVARQDILNRGLERVGSKKVQGYEQFPWRHTTLQAVNPVHCAVALATIRVIEEENLIDRSVKLGNWMFKRLLDMKKEHALIGDVRGKGLMIGVELVKDHKTKVPAGEEAGKVLQVAKKNGLILRRAGISNCVLRFCPSLVIPQELMEKGLDIIEDAISKVENESLIK